MIKKSLEENQEHILSELPEKFHDAFKAEVAAAPETIDVTQGDTLENITQELNQHPHVDASAVPTIDPNSHKPAPTPSEAEQKAAMDQELQRTLAEIKKQSSES
ncbi:hypothetical protein [Rubritalea tangerina]|uniref:Uncharacterized protein n=1 Tax=Rubritalea tangerina TaxID=430798 RepID=A0ABW4ZGP6_9BACT